MSEHMAALAPERGYRFADRDVALFSMTVYVARVIYLCDGCRVDEVDFRMRQGF